MRSAKGRQQQQRFTAATAAAIWHNDRNGQDIKRPLLAYDPWN